MPRAHPLLAAGRVDQPLNEYLARVGTVLCTIAGHDSGHSSYGVRVGSERWFVKHGEGAERIAALEAVVEFHRQVRHPAIVPLRGAFRTPTGMAVVHEWRNGESLNDPLAPGALPRDHPDSASSRFRGLPTAQIMAALDRVFDAHLEVAARGYVAVDFYDGAMLYDFRRRQLHLCDLDEYRRGPYVLDRDRQLGSRRFMAPEEFQRGALIDQRTTVYSLGRTAFVFLSDGPRGEEGADRWRGAAELHAVARRATQPDPSERFPTVAAFAQAWREAAGAGRGSAPI